MGTLTSKYPVTSYFVIGYSIGFPLVYYMPDTYFNKLRRRLFRNIEVVEIKVDPQNHRMKISQDKIISQLSKLSLDNSDEDSLRMKKEYIKRVQKLSDEEEEWIQNIKDKEDEIKNYEELINEYNAVKRITQRQNKV